MTETWRDALRRVGALAGREAECLDAFDRARAGGAPEHEAAHRVLAEHGLLEAVELPGDPSSKVHQPA